MLEDADVTLVLLAERYGDDIGEEVPYTPHPFGPFWTKPL